MAKAILAHDISPVWVPSPEVEGIRDLAGAYDGATARLATAKQRLLAFLAKRGFVYGGTTPAVSTNLKLTTFANASRRMR